MAALCDPARYPDPVERVTRIDTHISTLLLAGDYVYKLKKPVTFDFVDYAPLERRRFYCAEEVRLNRRFAPALYLDCVAIYGTPDAPCWQGPGEAIEYAVRMRRFAQDDQADVRADRDALTPADAEALAEVIADYHASAPPCGDVAHARADALRAAAEAELAQLAPLIDGDAARADLQHVQTWMRATLNDRAASLDRRAADGSVRECHGDMHLANLVCHAGRWAAFDCIEFDAALRCIDVMSDLAFPVMDLHAHAKQPLAHRLLNRYLERSGDYAGLAVLRFYLVLRALIRAKVLALSARAADDDKAAALRARHLGYLDSARRLSSAPPPRLVITHGVSGSGKSWAARRVATTFGYIRIRSDVERKRLHDLPAESHRRAALGAGIYGATDSRATYRRLFDLAEVALNAGWRVILDATFLDAEQRAAARDLAARCGCPFHILSMTTPLDVVRARVEKRAREGRGVSDADTTVLESQLARFVPLAQAEMPFALTSHGGESGIDTLFAGLEEAAD